MGAAAAVILIRERQVEGRQAVRPQRRRVSFVVVTGMLAALAVATVACRSNDANSLAPGAGATRTLLTDAPFPFDNVARVDLYVVSVSASLSPDTGAASSGGNFVTLATPNRRIDVLALQGGRTDELGSTTLSAGAFTAVRMIIDTDSSSITLKNGKKLTGSSSPRIQWQSSAGRPVLNALIQEQILVPRAGGTVVIDYDVGQAFIPTQQLEPLSPDSGFIFSPVLRAADATRTGSITGSVRARGSSGAAVVDASLRLYIGNPAGAENTWSVLGTAKTDSSGAFRFSYVTRSSYWAGIPAFAGKSYIVVVDPPTGAGLGRALLPGVVVSVGGTTSVGTLVLP